MQDPYEKLKVIRFEGEMLPNWAQLLDAAARLCPVPDETRSWFSRLTHSSGVDDARTVLIQSKRLVNTLRDNKQAVIAELERKQGDLQAPRIFAAWEYALDTMIQAATSKKTCSWQIEGMEDTGDGDLGGGDITLRRV
ncbi:MAG TPA: hypothetical protein VN794_19850 [Methylomirabilota bacterium]|jgi:hypothetical protein|nr:hypothetical protein [Methylomirabilota bacterium]